MAVPKFNRQSPSGVVRDDAILPLSVPRIIRYTTEADPVMTPLFTYAQLAAEIGEAAATLAWAGASIQGLIVRGLPGSSTGDGVATLSSSMSVQTDDTTPPFILQNPSEVFTTTGGGVDITPRLSMNYGTAGSDPVVYLVTTPGVPALSLWAVEFRVVTTQAELAP